MAPMTRAQMKEQFPGYDNSLAIEKIALEDSLNTRAGKFRRNVKLPLELILTIGFPVSLPFLAKAGYAAPNPDFWQYAVGACTGFLIGYALGTAVGTLAYETVDREGEINQFFQRLAHSFSRSSAPRI